MYERDDVQERVQDKRDEHIEHIEQNEHNEHDEHHEHNKQAINQRMDDRQCSKQAIS